MLGRGIYDDQGRYSADLVPGASGLTLHSSKGGTFTANGTSAVTVVDSRITFNSVIVFTPKTVGGTPSAAPYVTEKTVGTSFKVKAGAGDSSVYNYIILELVP